MWIAAIHHFRLTKKWWIRFGAAFATAEWLMLGWVIYLAFQFRQATLLATGFAAPVVGSFLVPPLAWVVVGLALPALWACRAVGPRWLRVVQRVALVGTIAAAACAFVLEVPDMVRSVGEFFFGTSSDYAFVNAVICVSALLVLRRELVVGRASRA